jgi:hypothetical protein
VKSYEIGIVYRFQADDPKHAIEQFVDAVIQPENRSAYTGDLEAAINHVEELPSFLERVREARRQLEEADDA